MEHQKKKVVKNLYMRASYWNFCLELFVLVTALYSYCGDKKLKRNFFQIICFNERKNMAVEENLRVTINFYNKRLPVTTRNKNIYQRKL